MIQYDGWTFNKVFFRSQPCGVDSIAPRNPYYVRYKTAGSAPVGAQHEAV